MTSLGFLDGAIGDDTAAADVLVNRVGGMMTLPFDASLSPAHLADRITGPCAHCKRTDARVLLAQIYAPLPESPFHRVLYVFGCNRFHALRAQWPDIDSLARIKRQRVEKERQQELERARRLKAASPPAGGTCDFGGSMFSASATAFPTMSNPPSTTSTNASGFTELWSMIAAREKQAEEAAILVSDESTSSVSSDSPYSSDAAVDADTGDTSIAALTSTFDKSLRVVDDQQTQKLAPPLPSYYLAVDLESNCTSTTQSNAHEQALLSEYERREGTNLRSLEEAVAGGDDDTNKWSGEAYEQSHPKYISKTFRRFQKTLALQPEQVLRYHFDGVPLWYGEDVIKQELTSSSAQHPRACSRCGGHRAFELQLMPTLLSLLPIEEHARKCAIESDPATSQPDAQSTSTNQQQQVMPWGMEWGTLLVYSCAKDCPPKSGPASAIDMLTPAQLDDLIAACRRRDPAVVSYAEEEVYVQLD